MLLRHFYLFVRPEQYTDEFVTAFGFETRYLCNFVERKIGPMRFHANGFAKLCVEGVLDPSEDCPIVSEHAANPTVALSQGEFEVLRNVERHEYLVSRFLEGVRKCARFHALPEREIVEAIDDFRRGGYKNEWIHQAKLLRELGLKAFLHCELRADVFRLRLRLEKHGVCVYDEQILETLPDEMIFAHKFKDVVAEGGQVVVRNRFGKPLASVSIDGIPA